MTRDRRKSQANEPSRPYHHGDLRAALLSSAETALEKEGAEAVSFRAIARSVGVSQTAPYNHFENRQGLLAALVEKGYVRLGQMQDEAAATEGDHRSRIMQCGLAYIAFARSRPQLYRLMLGVGLPDWHAREQVVAAKLRSIQPLQDTLASWGAACGWPSPKAEVSALACWSMVHGLALLRIDRASLHFDGASPEDAIERASLTLLLEGLEPIRPARRS